MQRITDTVSPNPQIVICLLLFSASFDNFFFIQKSELVNITPDLQPDDLPNDFKLVTLNKIKVKKKRERMRQASN
jgi:hypothetical protein